MRALLIVCVTGCATACAGAQTIGTIAATDATVTPTAGHAVAIAGGRVQLAGASTVEASPERSALVSLTRGGEVRACQTTVVHLSETPGSDPKLVLALDRGAIEIKRKAAAGDVLMTPDLRFETAEAGPLDLRIRVVFEGDTCVENRGRHAPTLMVQDAFGELSYQVKPGQHVMFERGSLRSVLDRETTPCGCPAEAAPISLADAALRGRPGAEAHPFPAAASAGLTPVPAPAEPEKPGETHLQIATALDNAPAAPAPAPAAPAPVPVAPAPPAAPVPAKGGPLAAIGRFFQRIFVH